MSCLSVTKGHLRGAGLLDFVDEIPGGQEIHISPEGDVSATRYYSFGGQMVAVRESSGLGGVDSLVLDHQGSVIASIPNTEWAPESVEVVRTDPFGGAREGSDDDVPGDKRFLGLTRDEGSGLSLLGARYYDASNGSFLSVDPVLNSAIPAQFNGYAYAWNNPTTFSDPSGLRPADEYSGTGQSRTQLPNAAPPRPGPHEHTISWLLDQISACGGWWECTQQPNHAWREVMEIGGFNYQGDGRYEALPDSWQLWGGYNEGYDAVHSLFTLFRSEADYLEFTYDGTTMRLWWWNGYYLNLGSGGEVGTYALGDDVLGDFGHFQAAPDSATPEMSVTVRDRASQEVLAQSDPDGPQQWVGGWNAREQGNSPADLQVDYSITFPTEDMFDEVRDSDDVDRLGGKYDFEWVRETRTLTFSSRRRRR